jgi:hypothetical protein
MNDFTELPYSWDTPVKSSSIQHVYYDHQTKVLYVQFHNGTVAGYKDVTTVLVDALVSNSSVGRFYNDNIRGKFTGVNAHGTLVKRQPVQAKKPHLQAVTDYSKVQVAAPTEPVKVLRDYTVRAYVLIEETYQAGSMEEACQMLTEEYDEATVKEVVISFE